MAESWEEPEDRIKEIVRELVEMGREGASPEHAGWGIYRISPDGFTVMLHAEPDEPMKALSVCRSFLAALLSLRDRSLDEDKLDSIARMVLRVLGLASSGPEDLATDLFGVDVKITD